MSRVQKRKELVEQLLAQAKLTAVSQMPELPFNVRYHALVMAEQAQENVEDLRKELAESKGKTIR